MTAYYHVVTTAHGVRGYAEGGNADFLTIIEAMKIAHAEYDFYSSAKKTAKVEVIHVKDNGQHGQTVLEYRTDVCSCKTCLV